MSSSAQLRGLDLPVIASCASQASVQRLLDSAAHGDCDAIWACIEAGTCPQVTGFVRRADAVGRRWLWQQVRPGDPTPPSLPVALPSQGCSPGVLYRCAQAAARHGHMPLLRRACDAITTLKHPSKRDMVSKLCSRRQALG